GDIVAPGATLGTIRPEIAAATGLPLAVKVVVPPSHDTAAAVAAIPAAPDANWAFLSSGTWSLLGAEIPKALINEASREANFTNELGIDNTVRFLKNVSGLWLVQESRRQWEREGTVYDYTQLTQLADQAPAFRTLIPIAHPDFTAPPNMIEAIQRIARDCGEPVPLSPGEIVRCCLESLALQYNATLTTLETLLGRRFDVLHVVGGGTKNALLTQSTANAIGRRVIAGPDEATAMGNLLTQAMGLGHLKDLAAIRTVTRSTCRPTVYEPKDHALWQTAAQRYAKLKSA
ncbi:MAG: FGGY-family carbohydrate kinase, partial [Tepidisphaeraceae bacterium]